jgi:protein TonB
MNVEFRPSVHPARAAGPGGDAILAHYTELAEEEARRRRILGHAILAAIVLHAAIAVLVPRPEAGPETLAAVERQLVRLSPTPRFRPPEPPPVRVEAPTRRVPVPDPTPDDPEPLRALELPTAEIVVPIDTGLGILPSPPPAPAQEFVLVGGEIVAPGKLFAPKPIYPEVARRIRKQGTVVLQLRLDRAGTVVSIEPLTRLGFGLEQAAVDAVGKWRFAPATQRGRPVAVIYNLSVRFSLEG